jgi:S1-C subfamily serine protease
VSAIGEPDGAIQLGSGEQPHRYIQTDAKLNPGNSDSPLVNLNAEVIGITTVINVDPGGSYEIAIPIDEALRVATLLIREGRIRYSYIGATTLDLARLPPNVPRSVREKLPGKGAMVVEVTAHGPAANAGLQAGDLITKIGSHPVEVPDDVRAAVAEQRIGSSASVEYTREGVRRTVEVRVAELTLEESPQDEEQ